MRSLVTVLRTLEIPDAVERMAAIVLSATSAAQSYSTRFGRIRSEADFQNDLTFHCLRLLLCPIDYNPGLFVS